MWRSLFLAFGIVLVVMGLECIVVGRFTIARDARLPPFLKKMIDNSADLSPLAGSGTAGTGQSNANVAPARAVSGYGGIPNTVSGYGPSRFGGGQYGNGPYLGSAESGAGAANPQFSLSGFGGESKGDTPAVSVSGPSIGRTRIVHTQDWMPWSLIAAGSIIVLFTNTMGLGDFGNGTD